jgi:hypothetical protein
VVLLAENLLYSLCELLHEQGGLRIAAILVGELFFQNQRSNDTRFIRNGAENSFFGGLFLGLFLSEGCGLVICAGMHGQGGGDDISYTVEQFCLVRCDSVTCAGMHAARYVNALLRILEDLCL